jgi:hypothetical protein|tara:strand:+ start:492 stop:887 length:396 start_codon:yes stop_codon:yes gene_type:complete
MGDKVTPDKLAKTYLRIRAERSMLSAKYKEEDGNLIRQMDTVKQAMLDHCEAHNVESVRTSEGLFFRSTKKKYWVSEWDAMHRLIVEENAPQLLDKRINQANMREFLEENPDLKPEGLEIEEEVTISVRKK